MSIESREICGVHITRGPTVEGYVLYDTRCGVKALTDFIGEMPDRCKICGAKVYGGKRH